MENDPLLTGPEREELMRKYDLVADEVQRYRWRHKLEEGGSP